MHNKLDEIFEQLRWLLERPKVMNILFDTDDESTPEECIEIIELLEEKSYYELIIYLVLRKRYNRMMERVLSKLIGAYIVREWESMGTVNMIGELKHLLNEEIDKKE